MSNAIESSNDVLDITTTSNSDVDIQNSNVEKTVDEDQYNPIGIQDYITPRADFRFLASFTVHKENGVRNIKSEIADIKKRIELMHSGYYKEKEVFYRYEALILGIRKLYMDFRELDADMSVKPFLVPYAKVNVEGKKLKILKQDKELENKIKALQEKFTVIRKLSNYGLAVKKAKHKLQQRIESYNRFCRENLDSSYTIDIDSINTLDNKLQKCITNTIDFNTDYCKELLSQLESDLDAYLNFNIKNNSFHIQSNYPIDVLLKKGIRGKLVEKITLHIADQTLRHIAQDRIHRNMKYTYTRLTGIGNYILYRIIYRIYYAIMGLVI